QERGPGRVPGTCGLARLPAGRGHVQRLRLRPREKLARQLRLYGALTRGSTIATVTAGTDGRAGPGPPGFARRRAHEPRNDQVSRGKGRRRDEADARARPASAVARPTHPKRYTTSAGFGLRCDAVRFEGAVSPLAERPFRLLWLGRVASSAG